MRPNRMVLARARPLLVLLALGAGFVTLVASGQSPDTRPAARVRAHLPPDPADRAPPNDPTVATDFAASTEFLYTGPDPIQTGVAPGTIEERRVAVIRGRVLDRDSNPLPGVTITILDHPELGQTLSRVDGVFDLAVNGGGLLTIKYESSRYLPAQRQIDAPWQDFIWAPDVVLVPLDPQATTVDLTQTEEDFVVAQGSEVTDADGTRQATMLFAQGTQAELVMPDGSTQPISTLTVRATEYTIGQSGPNAMPAELPPTSGYEYCAELSADEAIAAGAGSVQFDRPIWVYVEDFIGFPVGGAVPVGYYDRQRGEWIPSQNGRVLQILSITDGKADLDTDGDGLPDDEATLAELGITDEERAVLASLYQPGQVLWRVPMRHFTPWDANWPYGPPDDAENPNNPEPPGGDQEDEPNLTCGSVIEVQNQVLGERIPIAGTPFTLNYRSNRTPGWKAERSLDVQLADSTVPATLKKVSLAITVAGRRFSWDYAPASDLTHTFEWDGNDIYGRRVYGEAETLVRITYVYGAVYYPVPADWQYSFARMRPSTEFIPARETSEVILTQTWRTVMGRTYPAAQGQAGWTIDVHHLYSPAGQTLWLGDGTRRTGPIGDIISTVAGNGTPHHDGDGGPATRAAINNPFGVAVAVDGSILIADSYSSLIRRVDPQGIMTTVAGGGNPPDGLGDGGLATDAMLDIPCGVAAAADGSFLIADSIHSRIRRVDRQGIISTVAGNGNWEFSGDGGAATLAGLNVPWGVAVAADGSILIADTQNTAIRRVDPQGIIFTVAGRGTNGDDGTPATDSPLGSPHGVAVAADGSLVIADTGYDRVRRVDPSGLIWTVAGGGNPPDGLGDGGLATEARLIEPGGVALAPDGSILIAERHNRIRRVDPYGIISTVAGNGSRDFGGDGGPATDAMLKDPNGVAVTPNGRILIADSFNHRIRRVAPVDALEFGGSLSDVLPVASRDGSELYIFDVSGRHLRTLDGVSGEIRYEFAYDTDDRLIRITDAYGNVTTVERDTDGNATAIVAPHGQRTELGLTNGYLTRITNPEGEYYDFTYTDDGLLTAITDPNEMTDPGNHTTTYSYDSLGRLERVDDADQREGSFQTLERTTFTDGYEVKHTSAEGVQATYRVEKQGTGDKLLTNTLCCGQRVVSEVKTDGTTVTTRNDGTITTLKEGPDPRWGMHAPFDESVTVQMPSGLTSQTEAALEATFDPDDPFSLETLTHTETINGRTYTSTFDAATQTITRRTPMNRVLTTTIDEHSRPTRLELPGLYPVDFTYDSEGRLSMMTQGSGLDTRLITAAYNPEGYLASLTDPLARVFSYWYNLAGRVVQTDLPGSRQVFFGYDSKGNLTSLVPPDRPAHGYEYTPVDLVSVYRPPDAGFPTRETTYDYNRDRRLTNVTRPDGLTIDLGYDTAGRLQTATASGGTITYAYDGTTGKLASISMPDGGVVSFTYNGTLTTGLSWAGTVAGSVGFTYDNDFRVWSETVNGGNEVTFVYDTDSLLTGAGAMTLTRDPAIGWVTGTTLGTVTTSYGYNSFGELASLDGSAGATSLLSVQYTRDLLGRITQKSETIGGVTTAYEYAYDLAGRLVEVKTDSVVTATYAYDLNGNRVSYTGPGGPVTGSYDDQDRLLQYGNITYTYTANGELVTRTENGQTTTYTYDEFGNLLSVVLPNGTNVEYLIDGSDRRIGKKMTGVLVQGFLYESRLRPVAELDGAGQIVSRFVYGTNINVPDYMIKGGVTYRLIKDHLGSPRLVVDAATGAIAQRMDYDEFGRLITDTNPGFQPFGFAGGLYDPQTGLTRFGVRDYDPEIGRWTSRDPIQFSGGSGNLYEYARNDPRNRIDPEGTLDTKLIQCLIALANCARRIDELRKECQNECDAGGHGGSMQKCAVDKCWKSFRICVEVAASPPDPSPGGPRPPARPTPFPRNPPTPSWP
ncbi:MAG: RHS repeat-associated core domain-containing protein [Planctomycetota bacterium]